MGRKPKPYAQEAHSTADNPFPKRWGTPPPDIELREAWIRSKIQADRDRYGISPRQFLEEDRRARRDAMFRKLVLHQRRFDPVEAAVLDLKGDSF